MNILTRLLRGCYSHLDLRERDAQGKAILVCQTCGDVRPMLESEVLKGPRFYQAETLGQPKGSAQIVSRFHQRKVG